MGKFRRLTTSGNGCYLNLYMYIYVYMNVNVNFLHFHGEKTAKIFNGKYSTTLFLIFYILLNFEVKCVYIEGYW